MNIEGKNIILTGASSGIGLALLNQLVNIYGTRIIAVARNIENIPAIKNIVYPLSADLTLPQQIDLVFEYADKIFTQVDIFIANAGFAYMEQLDIANWKHNEKIFALNTFSPIYSLQKFVDKGKDNAKEKYFVCVGSAASKVVLPYYSLYCASKSAISTFLETYRYELSKNIKVACVYPIATRTPFFEKAENNIKPTIPFLSQNPENVASSILRGIIKNKTNIYTSRLFQIFECIGKVFPFVYRAYSKREKQKIDKRK